MNFLQYCFCFMFCLVLLVMRHVGSWLTDQDQILTPSLEGDILSPGPPGVRHRFRKQRRGREHEDLKSRCRDGDKDPTRKGHGD